MKIYIYSLKDPITNQVRYVGKTGNLKNRFINHKNSSNNSHVSRWIRTLLKQDLLPIIEVIEECDKTSWEEREIYWIAYYKNLYPDLCNIRKGGNEPMLPKRSKKKWSFKSNKYVVNASYANTTYYLGSFNTAKEAEDKYDSFQLNPILTLAHLSYTYYKDSVEVYKDNILVKEFPSIAICARELKTSGTNISRCLKSKAKTHKGFTFKRKS